MYLFTMCIWISHFVVNGLASDVVEGKQVLKNHRCPVSLSSTDMPWLPNPGAQCVRCCVLDLKK